MLYAVVMLCVFHLFVVLYEEPTLKQRFGASYEWCYKSVPRWIPRRGSFNHLHRGSDGDFPPSPASPHGREVADALRSTKWGRAIPLIFLDGESVKVDAT